MIQVEKKLFKQANKQNFYHFFQSIKAYLEYKKNN